MDYQHFHYDSQEYTQNNIEYLILNMIHLVTQIHHSMLEKIFLFNIHIVIV